MRLRCPACSANLKLKAELPETKTIKCPKCGDPFRISEGLSSPTEVAKSSRPTRRKPRSPDEEEEARRTVSEPDEREDEEERRPRRRKDEEEAPTGKKRRTRDEQDDEDNEDEERERRKRPRKSSRKKQRKKSNSPALFGIIGGGGVALVAIVLLVLWVSGVFGPAEDKRAGGAGGKKLPTNPVPPGNTPQGQNGLSNGRRLPGKVSLSAVSPDGKTIAVVFRGGKAKLLDAKTGNERADLAFVPPDPRRVAFSPKGTYLAIGSARGPIILWKVASGSVHEEFKGHSGEVNWIAFSPDERTFYSVAGDRSCRAWNVEAGGKQKFLVRHKRVIDCVAVSPDGKQVATMDFVDVFVWNAQTGKQEHHIDIGNFGNSNRMVFSSDGRYILNPTSRKKVHIWNVASEKSEGTLDHEETLLSIDLGRKSNILVVGANSKMFTVWDLKTRKRLKTFATPLRSVYYISLSDDASTLVTQDRSGTAVVWDLAAMLKE